MVLLGSYLAAIDDFEILGLSLFVIVLYGIVVFHGRSHGNALLHI